MRYSVLDMPTRVDDAVDRAGRAEAAGMHCYWAQVERADPVAVLAVVAYQARTLAQIRAGCDGGLS